MGTQFQNPAKTDAAMYLQETCKTMREQKLLNYFERYVKKLLRAQTQECNLHLIHEEIKGLFTKNVTFCKTFILNVIACILVKYHLRAERLNSVLETT